VIVRTLFAPACVLIDPDITTNASSVLTSNIACICYPSSQDRPHSITILLLQLHYMSRTHHLCCQDGRPHPRDNASDVSRQLLV